MLPRILTSLTHLALVVAWAIPATAVPVDVFFTGPMTSSDTRFGMSLADAVDARDSFGIPWVTPAILGGVGSSYATFQSPVLTFSPNPPTSPTANFGTEQWTVENTSGGSLEGSNFLIFTHTDVFTKSGVTIDYLDENVGLTIDAALDWVIVEAPSGAFGTFYYPAIELNGITANGAVSDPFFVDYVVNEPLVQAPASSGIFQLPQLAIGRGFTPVPEPGAAALLAAGLTALGIGRRFRW